MPFYYVYILQSDRHPNRHYTGFAGNLASRLKAHNSGQCHSTSQHRPWHITTAIRFTDRKKALRFEAYLKTASGRAFAKKHF